MNMLLIIPDHAVFRGDESVSHQKKNYERMK